MHETDARAKIEASGYLNFTIQKPGGYRPKANTIIAIGEKQLVATIEKGFVFFYNRFSGLVFGVAWEKKPMMARGMGRFPSSTCHSTPFAKFFAKCEFDDYDVIFVILVVSVLLWIG